MNISDSDCNVVVETPADYRNRLYDELQVLASILVIEVIVAVVVHKICRVDSFPSCLSCLSALSLSLSL